MIAIAERSYSEKYLKKYRLLYPVLGHVGKPKDYDRFFIQAKSCMSHNAYPELDKIICQTLVIGGGCDKIVGGDASRELSEKIKNCELFIPASNEPSGCLQTFGDCREGEIPNVI